MKIIKPNNDAITHYQEKQLIYGPRKVQEQTRRLLTQFVEFAADSPNPIMDKEITKTFMPLVDFCLTMRQGISRNFRGEIQHVSSKDGPARFLKMCYNLANHHAKLFGFPTLTKLEESLIKRVLLDTCPNARLVFVRLLLGSDTMLTAKDINQSVTEYAHLKSVYRIIEEFEALRLIVTKWQGKTKYFSLIPELREQMIAIGIEPLMPILEN